MAADGTPWCKLFAGTRDHEKFDYLADALGIEQPHALGLMVRLWCWATVNHPDGELPRQAGMLARKAGWAGDGGEFVAACVASGLLDDAGDAYEVHNFCQYQERYKRTVAQRVRREKRRSENDAAREALQKPHGSPTEASLRGNSRVERRGEEKRDEGEGDSVHECSPVDNIDRGSGGIGNDDRLTLHQVEVLGYQRFGSIAGSAYAQLERYFPLAGWEWKGIAGSKAMTWGYAARMLAGYRREVAGPGETTPGARPSTSARNRNGGIVDAARVLEEWAYAEDRADSKG